MEPRRKIAAPPRHWNRVRQFLEQAACRELENQGVAQMHQWDGVKLQNGTVGIRRRREQLKPRAGAPPDVDGTSCADDDGEIFVRW